jgi:hypothetical protein
VQGEFDDSGTGEYRPMIKRALWFTVALLLCGAKAFGQPTASTAETTGTLLVSAGKTKRNAPISAGIVATSGTKAIQLAQAVTTNTAVTTSSVFCDSYTTFTDFLTLHTPSAPATPFVFRSSYNATPITYIYDADCDGTTESISTALDASPANLMEFYDDYLNRMAWKFTPNSLVILPDGGAGATSTYGTSANVAGAISSGSAISGVSLQATTGDITATSGAIRADGAVGVSNAFSLEDGLITGDNIASNRDVHAERNAYVRNVLVVGDGRQMLGQSDGTLLFSLGDNLATPTPYTTTTVCIMYPAADGMYFKTGAVPGYSGTGGNQFKFDNDILTTGTFRPDVGYKSTDGSDGITTTVTGGTFVFKNGLLVGHTP